MTELDIGQPGSALRIAGDAEATVSVRVGAAEIAEMVADLPEQNIRYVQVLGMTGRPIAWRCWVKAKDKTTMRTIKGAIEQKLTGINPVGGAIDPKQMHSTRMNDAHDNDLATVRLREVQMLGRQYPVGGDWQGQEMLLLFEDLGDAVG